MEKLGIRLASLIRGNNTEKITMDNLFRDRESLVSEYVEKQNNLAIHICAIMMLFLDAFWFITYSIVPIASFNSVSLMATIITSAASIYMLCMMNAINKTNSKLFRWSVVYFHVSIMVGVMLFELAITTTSQAASNGPALATFLILMCTFIPMIGSIDSLVTLSVMFGSVFLAYGFSPEGSYSLVENLTIRVCFMIGYIAFRGITLRNANMISDLSEASYVDFQTKTLNRKALSEYLESLPSKDVSTIGFMKFDVDGFKRFNDKYSHSKGDIVLTRMCEAINEEVKVDNAIVFRYGGDEFIAVIEDPTEEKLLKTALKIRDTVQSLKIQRDDGSWSNYVTVTVGCTLASKFDCIERDVLGEADAQMFIGKKGANNCVVFKGRIFIAEGEISMELQPTKYTDRVAQAVSEAMRKHQIKPYYQPLYDTNTQKMVGAEALARWIKDDNTLIHPSEFIPELEKNSSILSLDWYMYEEVCSFLRRQMDMGNPVVRISVNFSRMHALYERDISDKLCELADKYSVPHNLIEIEITESVYIRIPNIEPFIRSIRSKGFTIAVDDFGTGTSSLGFVKSVDVDTLKIDRSLVTKNISDDKERVLLESVIMLAHRLQLNSVAEGVETMEQLGLLKTLGCNQIQGYIFSFPLPENEFVEACMKQAVTNPKEVENVAFINRSTSIQLLVDTVFKYYPIVLISNVTRNSFYTMTGESFISHQFIKSGMLTDLIDEICETIHPDDVAKFRSVADRQSQLDNYANGIERTWARARMKGEDDSNYKYIENVTYFIKEKPEDDLLAITMCKEINE